MIKLLNNLFIIFLLTSCQFQKDNRFFDIINKENVFIKKTTVPEKSTTVQDKSTTVPAKRTTVLAKSTTVSAKSTITTDLSTIKYVIGDPYFIDGVKYIPKENYSYNKFGLATFYGKELHNKRTVNNDLNKVTELLGRHKTLPIPSIVKITNLENGLSLVIKINDRHADNSSIIQVSRKTAQLLLFYNNELARVKVEIMPEPSKQIKLVTQSMSSIDINETIEPAPTEDVSILDLDDELISEKLHNNNFNSPIEMGFEEVNIQDLYLKIYGFNTNIEIKNVILSLGINYKFLTQKEGENYSLLLGPLENKHVKNLLTSFISKGYNKNDIILK